MGLDLGEVSSVPGGVSSKYCLSPQLLMSLPLTTDSRGYKKSFPDTRGTPRGCLRYSEGWVGNKDVQWAGG